MGTTFMNKFCCHNIVNRLSAAYTFYKTDKCSTIKKSEQSRLNNVLEERNKIKNDTPPSFQYPLNGPLPMEFPITRVDLINLFF